MITIARARMLLQTIEFCAWINDSVTRHMVAKNALSMSRSTVYRCLNKMIERGQVELLENGNVAISEDGYEFLRKFNELDFDYGKQ